MMNTFRVYYNNGDTLVTDMNATLEEAQRYYLGRAFEDSDEKLRTPIKVEYAVPRYCIQCKDIISGKVGDFLYEQTPNGLMAISPVFTELTALFLYLKEKGIENAKGPGRDE